MNQDVLQGPCIMQMGSAIDLSMIPEAGHRIIHEWYECDTGFWQIALTAGDPETKSPDLVKLGFRHKLNATETYRPSPGAPDSQTGGLHCSVEIKSSRSSYQACTVADWNTLSHTDQDPFTLSCAWNVQEILEAEEGTTGNVRVAVAAVWDPSDNWTQTQMEETAKAYLDQYFDGMKPSSAENTTLGRFTYLTNGETSDSRRSGASHADNEKWLAAPRPGEGDVPFSDIILKSHEHGAPEIHAHRAVLGLRSSYFNAMFGKGFKESDDPIVVLSDISHKGLTAIVNALYESQPDVRMLKTPDLLCEVWRYAETHEMHDIALRCAQIVHGCPDVVTCVTFFKIAHELGHEQVADALAAEMVNHPTIPAEVMLLTADEACDAVGRLKSADAGCRLVEAYINGRDANEVMTRIVNSIRVEEVSVKQLKSISTRNVIAQYGSRKMIMVLLDKCLAADIGILSENEALRKTRQCAVCSVWFYCRCSRTVAAAREGESA